jgi:hypothetical protein
MSIYNNQIGHRLLLDGGPLLLVTISIPSALERDLAAKNLPMPQALRGLALIDTGASRTCVDATAIRRLGVSAIDRAMCGTANGVVQQNLFPARFSFPAISLDIEFASVIGVDLTGQASMGQDIVALVGRDVLSRCVLTYNGVGGFITLAF